MEGKQSMWSASIDSPVQSKPIVFGQDIEPVEDDDSDGRLPPASPSALPPSPHTPVGPHVRHYPARLYIPPD